MTKWIIGVVVVVVLAGAAWWSGWFKMAPQAAAPTPAAQTAQTQPEPDNGLSASGDTSDAALAQDAAAIDTQMAASNQDSNDINSSMNDQAVAQTY